MKLSWLFFLALGWLSVSSACTPQTPLPVSSPAAEPTVAPSPTVPTFQNPVLRENFADPFILQVGDTFYAYATNNASKNISLARSTDLVKWQILPDAMPALPRWARLTGGLVWAPEVIQIGEQFVLYYTARDKQSDKQCVGVAVSDKPEGKFKDTSDAPLVCQAELGGTIDASPFRDEDGKLYLYFKNDGNCCNLTTYIYVQQLAPDGLRLLGDPIPLVRNDALWEGRVVEAPTMFKHEGRYYLFFSANNYAGHEYAVGYAICESPVGPCQDAPENPILQSDLTNPPAMVIGPGHQALLQIGGQTWMFYHAWEVVGGSRRGERRLMWLDRLDWVDGKPVLRGPTTAPQPLPQLP